MEKQIASTIIPANRSTIRNRKRNQIRKRKETFFYGFAGFIEDYFDRASEKSVVLPHKESGKRYRIQYECCKSYKTFSLTIVEEDDPCSDHKIILAWDWERLQFNGYDIEEPFGIRPDRMHISITKELDQENIRDILENIQW